MEPRGASPLGGGRIYPVELSPGGTILPGRFVPPLPRLDLAGADQVAEALDLRFGKLGGERIDDVRRRLRVHEVRGADLDRGGARNHELEDVVRVRDPADPDHGDAR